MYCQKVLKSILGIILISLCFSSPAYTKSKTKDQAPEVTITPRSVNTVTGVSDNGNEGTTGDSDNGHARQLENNNTQAENDHNNGDNQSSRQPENNNTRTVSDNQDNGGNRGSSRQADNTRTESTPTEGNQNVVITQVSNNGNERSAGDSDNGHARQSENDNTRTVSDNQDNRGNRGSSRQADNTRTESTPTEGNQNVVITQVSNNGNERSVGVSDNGHARQSENDNTRTVSDNQDNRDNRGSFSQTDNTRTESTPTEGNQNVVITQVSNNGNERSVGVSDNGHARQSENDNTRTVSDNQDNRDNRGSFNQTDNTHTESTPTEGNQNVVITQVSNNGNERSVGVSDNGRGRQSENDNTRTVSDNQDNRDNRGSSRQEENDHTESTPAKGNHSAAITQVSDDGNEDTVGVSDNGRVRQSERNNTQADNDHDNGDNQESRQTENNNTRRVSDNQDNRDDRGSSRQAENDRTESTPAKVNHSATITQVGDDGDEGTVEVNNNGRVRQSEKNNTQADNDYDNGNNRGTRQTERKHTNHRSDTVSSIIITPRIVTIRNVSVGSAESGSFTITNKGTADLIISDIRSDNDAFTVSPQSAAIPPDGSQEVTVTFTPVEEGNDNATVTIVSNDDDETLEVRIKGYAKQPDNNTHSISDNRDNGDNRGTRQTERKHTNHNSDTVSSIIITPRSVTIGSVSVGSSKSGSFTITNKGAADLIISDIRSDNDAFTVSPQSAAIPPDGSQEVTVTFTPVEEGNDNATVTIVSNDDDEIVEVKVRGYVKQIGDNNHTKNGRNNNREDQGSGKTSNNELIIPLHKGWNQISSNISPNSSQIELVFNDIIDDVIIVKNGNGQVYMPSYGINQIANWEITDGYQVYMVVPDTLAIHGTYVNPVDVTFNLRNGWSLISYIGLDNVSPETAFNSIAADLTILKNGEGNVYWPEGGFNSIGSLTIGEGYWIRLITSKIFSYQEETSQPFLAKIINTETATHFTPVTNTGNNATILIKSEIQPKINGEALTVGDEIAVLTPESLCVGYGVWEGNNLAITVWGDDPQTDEIDGIKTGEAYSFSIWDAETQSEYGARVTYSSGNASYGVNDIVVLESLSGGEPVSVDENAENIPSSFSLKQNYPNPFNMSTTIQYSLPSTCPVELIVYDILGRKIAVLAHDTFPPGTYNIIWDGRDGQGINVGSGIYIYKIKAGEFRDNGKLMLVK